MVCTECWRQCSRRETDLSELINSGNPVCQDGGGGIKVWSLLRQGPEHPDR